MKRHLVAASFLLLPLPALALDPADLAFTDLAIDGECRAVATLRNVGSTPLPVAAYDGYAGVGINFWVDSAAHGFGGMKLRGVDPGKALVTPGGSVLVPSLNKVEGTQTIGVELNIRSTYDDSNTTNNTLSKSLTCTQAYGDLAITAVTFDANCRPVVTLRNAGGGNLPDNSWLSDNVFAHRTADGAPAGQLKLKTADPEKKLRAPGGEVRYTDTPDTAPKATLRYELKKLGTGNVATNDTFEANVPTRCNLPKQAAPGVPDALKGDADGSTTTLKVPPVKKLPVPPRTAP